MAKKLTKTSKWKSKIRRWIKKNKLSAIAFIICFVISVSILMLPRHKENVDPFIFSEKSSVNAICELATLKSFYHNVVMYEVSPEGFVNNVLFWPFGNLVKVGYKQFWMEYSGIVETGIDASQIRISGPDANGTIEVYVPNARVFNVYADESTLTEPLSESGWFTKINGKEKADAFASAQSSMRKQAEEDNALLYRAKENAKLLLQQYIINTGKEMGIDYSIRWIED